MVKNRNVIFILGSLVLFVILAVIYANPVLTGKQLFQHDIVQYKGGAKELLDFRAQHGKETYWSDSMFGGMPTYQMGAQFRGDIIKNIDDFLNFFTKTCKLYFPAFLRIFPAWNGRGQKLEICPFRRHFFRFVYVFLYRTCRRT